MRINLFGGPGTGKSTTAAWLFAELKQLGINVELVTEYIKSWAWEKRVPTSYDQMYIFAKQLRAEDLLMRQKTHVVTDSPLPMQLVYAYRQQCPFANDLMGICKKFDADHPSLNILLARTVPFQPEGRYETLEEAKDIDSAIRALLVNYGEQFTEFDPQQDKDRLLAAVTKVLQV